MFFLYGLVPKHNKNKFNIRTGINIMADKYFVGSFIENPV